MVRSLLKNTYFQLLGSSTGIRTLPDSVLRLFVAEERESIRKQELEDDLFDNNTDEYILALWKKRSCFGRGLGWVYTEILDDLLSTVSENVLTSVPDTVAFDKDRVFVGPLPLNIFNALYVPTEHGSLILVDDLLSSLVFCITKVNVLSVPIFSIEDGVEISPDLSDENAAEYVGNFLYAFLYRRSIGQAGRLPNQGGALGRLLEDFTYNILRFVVAHELGHVLAGHLDGQKNVRREIPVCFLGLDTNFLTPDLILKGRKEEAKADEIGLELMLPRSILNIRKDEDIMIVSKRVNGVLMFLAFDYLISSVRKKIDGENYSESTHYFHAPAQLRIAAIRNWIDQIGVTTLCSNSDEFFKWIERLLPRIIRKVELLVKGKDQLKMISKMPSDKLWEVVNAPEEVNRAIYRLNDTKSWEEARTVIESYPILLSDDAEQVLKQIAVCVASFADPLMNPETDLKAAEQYYELVKRCRHSGIDEAFYTMMYK